jgi:molecular chaperone DnaJ
VRRDYYAVLGITATARPREIRLAYQRLARQYSPDVNFWDMTARALFDEIAEAYRILSDPDARALYDRLGPGLGNDALAAGRRGDDCHVSIELSFADAVAGATLRQSVARFSSCADCGATGRVDTRTCAACQGRGVRRVVETVEVTVPAGVDSGLQVRVPGQGHAGPFGGPRGDLVISTLVKEHPFFVRKGDAVHCEIPVSVWEALRGARIRIPTPLGETALVIPPGTAAGQVFRLRGLGVPRLADGTAGDLYVTVRVEVPRGLDARMEELVRELERLVPGPTREDLAKYRGGAS